MWKLHYHIELERVRKRVQTARKYKALRDKAKSDSEYVKIHRQEMKEKELEKIERRKLEEQEQKRKEHWDNHKNDTPRPFYHQISVTFKSRTNSDDSYSLPSDISFITPQAFFPQDAIAPSTIKKRSSVRHEKPNKRLHAI